MNTTITLPIIKKPMPRLLADDILSVSPQVDYAVQQGFSLKYYSEANPNQHNQGDSIHDFARGWIRYYGSEFIPNELYLKLKIKGL